MCFKYAMLAYFIFSGIIFAQSYSKAAANVKVKLINGAMFNIVKGNLSFNGLSKSFKEKHRREPGDGIILHVTRKNTTNVMISYGDAEVYKINAAGESTDKIKTSADFLLFQPEIHETNDLANNNVIEISNGSTFFLDREKFNGNLKFLIGGTIRLPNSSIDGFYSGTFAVSLVYY